MEKIMNLISPMPLLLQILEPCVFVRPAYGVSSIALLVAWRKYLDYVDGHHIGNAEPMPLYMRPTRSLSRQDIMDGMRDHYEGTPFDVNKDMGQGPWEMPYRPTPLQFKYEGKTYFNERPISTQQTADTYIAQLRSYLPDAIGGILLVWK